ncbi:MULTISPECIES: hypothetical protein, partial [unclassified Streptomyces]|uniref:hypothetical protein n=1 Tax=unclassified Streptomyces TaxID=2593676 RepID=UPI000B17A39D
PHTSHVTAGSCHATPHPPSAAESSTKPHFVRSSYTYKYGTGGTTDGTRIRTRKDNTTQVTTTYGYDSQGRLTRVEPQKTGEPSVASNYSYDKAG